jgi:putative transposase
MDTSTRGNQSETWTRFLERPSHRRRTRLDAACYRQLGAICSITVAVRGRRPVFADLIVAEAAADVLREHSSKTGVPVYAYCVMPDHVHLVIGPSHSCDIVTFVGQFKSLVLRVARRHGMVGRFWQDSFWDHFLRAEEAVEPVVAYVLNNPVRAGLVQEWREYPFSGSLVWEL